MNDSDSNSNTMLNYLHIDHFNKMRFITDDEYENFTILSKASFLSFMDDEIGKEINHFFMQIIPNNNDDLLNICISQTNKYVKTYYKQGKQIYDSVNKILSCRNQMQLILNKENTNDIALIIAYIYKQIESRLKQVKRVDSNKNMFYINNYTQLLSNVEKTLYKNIDAVNYYINKNKQENGVNKESDMYQYPHPNKKIPSHITNLLPVEMILLINKFQSIKKLIMLIDDIDQKRNNELILVLLNHKWLFPNIIEIELNLMDDPLQIKLDKICQSQLNRINRDAHRFTKTTKYDSTYKPKWNLHNDEPSFAYQPIEENNTSNMNMNHSQLPSFYEDETFFPHQISFSGRNTVNSQSSKDMLAKNNMQKNRNENLQVRDVPESLTKFVFENQEPFKAIIIYSYFISIMKKVKILSLVCQDSFSEEINLMLQRNNILIMNFSFLNFISKIDWLYNMNFNFNSLDTKMFEKLISIIYKNNSLSSLTLNFFSNETQYSPSGFFKLAKELGYNIKSLIKERNITNEQKTLTYESRDFDILLRNKLITNFSENMQKLFFVIQTKRDLTEISLYFDIPSILTYDDSYSLILLKFIVNFLSFLTNEPFRFNKVEIVAPYLKLDNRRFPIIEEIFEEIDLQNKNTLQTLVIQIQMYKILNIKHLIAINLTKLFLGDLDRDTFSCFLQFYTSDDFKDNSLLTSLKLSLGIVEVVYEEIEDMVKLFLENKTKFLDRQELLTSLKFKQKESLRNLLDFVDKKNKVRHVLVEIAAENKEILQTCYKEKTKQKADEFLLIKWMFSNKNIIKNETISDAVFKEVRELLLPSKNKKVVCKTY